MRKLMQLSLLLAFTFLFAQNSTEFNIRFYYELEGRSANVYADNDEFAPMSAEFKFTLQNMTTSLPDGSVVVVPPLAKKFLITRFTPINPKAGNSFKYSMGINIGNTLQKDYDADHIYHLPFAKNKSQRIYQGYHGKFSHQNIFALDFDLNEGDKIYAARGGTVVEMVEHHNRSCANISCAKYNNKIVIMHSDGTFADYSHLKLNGAEVKKGDVVETGQFIGYSGGTGYASGPHLHFGVYLPRLSGSRDYIRTKFKTAASAGEELVEGRHYLKNY